MSSSLGRLGLGMAGVRGSRSARRRPAPQRAASQPHALSAAPCTGVWLPRDLPHERDPGAQHQHDLRSALGAAALGPRLAGCILDPHDATPRGPAPPALRSGTPRVPRLRCRQHRTQYLGRRSSHARCPVLIPSANMVYANPISPHPASGHRISNLVRGCGEGRASRVLRWEAQDYPEVTSAAMATTALLPWRRVGVGLDGTLHDD